nr:glycosyltransferase family 2 protein [Marinobacter sp. CP1]
MSARAISIFGTSSRKKQGLSNARNRGVSESKGTYLLFTDDDADLPTFWVSKYLEMINKKQPDCLYSRINVLWDQPQPWWFDNRYNTLFVHLDYGEKEFWVDDFEYEFFGKNFCCKKSVLKDQGGFDANLGRSASVLAAGEETAIFRGLVERQKKILYFPGAEVGHRLKDVEYSLEYTERKILDGANSTYLVHKKFANRRLFDRPLYTVKNAFLQLAVNFTRFIRAAIIVDPKDRFYHYLQIRLQLKLLLLWVKN